MAAQHATVGLGDEPDQRTEGDADSDAGGSLIIEGAIDAVVESPQGVPPTVNPDVEDLADTDVEETGDDYRTEALGADDFIGNTEVVHDAVSGAVALDEGETLLLDDPDNSYFRGREAHYNAKDLDLAKRYYEAVRSRWPESRQARYSEQHLRIISETRASTSR